MNAIKKLLGVVWILLSVVSIYYVLTTAFSEMAAGVPEDATIFWPIIITIFVPIAVGLALFGLYSLQGEYEES